MQLRNVKTKNMQLRNVKTKKMQLRVRRPKNDVSNYIMKIRNMLQKNDKKSKKRENFTRIEDCTRKLCKERCLE